MLGSYTGKYTITKIDPATKTAIVRFHVDNPTGAESATRFPLIGYKDKSGVPKAPIESQIKNLRPAVPSGILEDRNSGPMRTINEHFEWYEPIKY